MIGLKIDGFDELLEAIVKAEKGADTTAERVAREAADTMHGELVSAMIQKSSKIKSGDGSGVEALARRMPAPEIDKKNGVVQVHVGFHRGSYNPNDISDGFKAVFLNYGTPRRRKHGQITALKFIDSAKKKAAPKIRGEAEKAQNQLLEKIR